jgi:hypothetical protein
MQRRLCKKKENVINTNSIWSTAEFGCISRNMNYKEYNTFHIITDQPGAKVTEKAYQLLKAAFRQQMEEDLKFHPEGEQNQD